MRCTIVCLGFLLPYSVEKNAILFIQLFPDFTFARAVNPRKRAVVWATMGSGQVLPGATLASAREGQGARQRLDSVGIECAELGREAGGVSGCRTSRLVHLRAGHI